MSPDQVQRSGSLLSGSASARFPAAAEGRARHLGCLILAAGSGSGPAPAVTADGIAALVRCPAVTAAARAGGARERPGWPVRRSPRRPPG